MGRPVARWNSLGKWFSIVVVLCFFLPFFGVSCKGMDVIHVSGADMVGGCRPGGLAVEAADQAKGMDDMPKGKHQKDNELGIDVTNGTDRVPLAIVAMLAAVAVAGAAFMRGRAGMTLALVMGLAGIGAMIGLYITVTRDMNTMVDAQKKPKGDGMDSKLARDMEKEMEIDAGSRWGFWVTLFGLAGVAGMAAAALKKGVDDPLPPPPQPAAPPPMA